MAQNSTLDGLNGAFKQCRVLWAIRSISALVIGIIVLALFLVFGATTSALAGGLFVGGIALVLAVYLWPGVSSGQACIVASVLLRLAIYAFVRGFGLLELTFIRQLSGITGTVSGVILALPFVRSKLAKK
ncbi:MAG: hypothetical protein LH471_11230 [Salinibacterium sp.]|nr:hypothetical protein [Salinibacterium sp.]